MILISKDISFIDNDMRPIFHEFGRAIMDDKNFLKNIHACEGQAHSPVYFQELKNKFLEKISIFINEILTLFKKILKEKEIGHKVKARAANKKIEGYINQLIEKSRDVLSSENKGNKLSEAALKEILTAFQQASDDLLRKTQTDLDLFLSSHKRNYRREHWSYKIICLIILPTTITNICTGFTVYYLTKNDEPSIECQLTKIEQFSDSNDRHLERNAPKMPQASQS